MQLTLSNQKVKILLFFLILTLSVGNVSAMAYKVTGISVSPQSTTVTYGTVSSTTYTLTLTETGNGNPSSNSTFSINWSAPLGVTVSGLGTISLTGNGQTVTFTVTTSINTPAGTTSFTISSTNNNVSSAVSDFVVDKRNLTITANSFTKVYGTTQSTPVVGSTAFTSSGLVGTETIGSVTLSYGAGALTATSAAGSTSTITPSAATGGTFSINNYNISYVNGTLTVVKATPTVTPTVGTYTYNASAQGPNAATNTGNGTSYTYTYTGTGSTVYNASSTRPVNAGTYSVVATVAATANYNSASSSAVAFTIQKAALTITASNATKEYGTTYTLGTTAFTSSGLLGGQTIGGVTLTSAGAASSAASGVYPIVPSAATGGTFNPINYTITYTNGSLTVNQGSVGGTVSGSTTVCNGGTTILVLSGHVGTIIRWESSTTPFTTWTTITNTSETYTTTPITQTTRFRAVVKSGNSPESNSTAAEVTTGTSTTWNGTAWSNGIPDSTKTATIAGAYTSNGTNINACSLTVNNNAVVVISSGDSVILNGALTVANGSTVTFNNNANLVQSGTTNTNSGSVIFKRESALIKRLDYTLWSSPVAVQQLQAFSPQTMSNRFYTYNSATNLYDQIAAPSTTNFDTAKGYLIRVANNHSATTPMPWLGQFTGVPNNGNYSYTLANGSAGNRFNLVGNPYPSPIYINEFINNPNNAVTITGTLYFWRKTNGSSNPSYCILTPLGGFVSNGHPSANAFAQNPNAIIESGQGFFVEGTGNGNGKVEFNNTMRANTHYNHFLKTATVERHRIWLNVTNTSGAFSQAMVGYLTDATQDVDTYIDGKYINDGEIALASLIGTTPYAIQGRALPFDASDVVPMSFKATNAGDYTIAIDHTDGLFSEGQSVYLRDNVTGTVHNLSSGDYTFSSEAGSFDTRFELIYQMPLGVSNPKFNAGQVVIYRDAGNNLIINTGMESMAAVKVFDINGKLILEKSDIHNTQTSLYIGLSNEVILVQIETENGTIVTKKYLLQRMTLKKDKNTMEKTQIANDE